MEMFKDECPYLDGRCPFFSIWVKKNEKLAIEIRKLYSNKIYERCRRYQMYEAGLKVPDDLWPSSPKIEILSCK